MLRNWWSDFRSAKGRCWDDLSSETFPILIHRDNPAVQRLDYVIDGDIQASTRRYCST